MPAQHTMKRTLVFGKLVDKITANGPAFPDQKKRPTQCGACLTEYKPLKEGNPKKRFREMLEQGWAIDAEAMTLRCPSCAGQ